MTPSYASYNDFKDQLLAAFRTNEELMNGASKTPFHQLRRSALKQFDLLGFPTIRHEEWKYSNVNGLFKEAFDLDDTTTLTANDLDPLEIPNLDGNIIYIVNGRYHPELSRIISPESQVQITSFAEAIKADPDFIGSHFARYADYQENAFTALNTALANDGVVIRVPDNTTVEQPIILRYITDARDKNIAAQPRNLIAVGKNAEVMVAEAYRTLGDRSSFVNVVTEIALSRDARMQYYKVQNETEKAYHIGTTQVNQSDNSHFYSATVTLNGNFVRNNLNIVLNGQHAEAFMYGLYMPNGRQHVDNHTLVDHAMPNSYSKELYKGILDDNSTGVFNGKIFVRPDAQKTNAYQSCKNVVLSPGASMNTKPQLEIFADDVKCSHGTTTGKLNDEALFYMRSRGIPKDEARSLLLYAFSQDVLSQIKIQSIRDYLERVVTEKLMK
ncbi:Fe-S cluster assembly protein SufD [Spirosoma endophyticum]|uniref:Iron-regulated ABC transporter permease protein SufD n=1 Tax=Spirosoma endophyticum TaxID=662367 RepID=A0A1I1YS43_9BACT|nr:Fe-S cluster assembly protein SufD [Spirosoma endophyticum]SFE22122.1 Iron-regulated ABC transporter permease protein SufD [Spirosoma endophyticum]